MDRKEVSLDKATQFLLDMDTLYRSTDDKDTIELKFRSSILNKYDIQVLEKLVEVLFSHGIPQRLIQLGAEDTHSLMRVCYELNKVNAFRPNK